jgi:hypothetical protein
MSIIRGMEARQGPASMQDGPGGEETGGECERMQQG